MIAITQQQKAQFLGSGICYRNLTLLQSGLVKTIICDPFFGFCYPATVGVDQVGAGLEVRLGQSQLKAFGEARYSRMFTTPGAHLEFVPATFGLRW